MLGEPFLRIFDGSRGVFARTNSFERAIQLGCGLLCGIGRATTSRAILALGRQHQDWSADYRLFSRAPWKAEDLFDGVLAAALKRVSSDWVVLAYDDTRLSKSGRKIKGAQFHHDPCARCKAFHTNLMYGLRFLQCSILVPLHGAPEFGARAVPIGFDFAPCVKKPGKKASEQDLADYKEAKTKKNLSTQFVRTLSERRRRLDDMGAKGKLLVATVDGSFCNKNCLREIPERTVILGRVRKDAKLCLAAPEGGRRKYGADKFTPESVLKDDAIPFKTARVVYGGAEREIRYKEVEGVLWQGATKTRRLTLIVIAPTPYRVSTNGPINYRDPAFLLCTSTGLDSVKLIQAYLDRWQIEVNHKDEKDVLGVGQAQVWSEAAIYRQPAFAVAGYSILLLATLDAFGPGRTDAFPPLPKWRTQPRRPSLNDMLRVLRQEFDDPDSALSRRIRPPNETANRNLADAA
jgi:hypothetical protein